MPWRIQGGRIFSVKKTPPSQMVVVFHSSQAQDQHYTAHPRAAQTVDGHGPSTAPGNPRRCRPAETVYRRCRHWYLERRPTGDLHRYPQLPKKFSSYSSTGRGTGYPASGRLRPRQSMAREFCEFFHFPLLGTSTLVLPVLYDTGRITNLLGYQHNP